MFLAKGLAIRIMVVELKTRGSSWVTKKKGREGGGRGREGAREEGKEKEKES